jgi:hypothetical protein
VARDHADATSNASLACRKAVAPAHNATLSPEVRGAWATSTPRLARAASACHTLTGSVLPLAVTGSAGRYSIARRGQAGRGRPRCPTVGSAGEADQVAEQHADDLAF